MNCQVLGNPASFDVAVTTYDTMNSDILGRALKQSVMWRCVVLDEAHKVKNEDSLISHAMREVHSQHTIMLTGVVTSDVDLGKLLKIEGRTILLKEG